MHHTMTHLAENDCNMSCYAFILHGKKYRESPWAVAYYKCSVDNLGYL